MVFIIAEVGSNWATFEDLKESVSRAKQAGADAVKFQCFSEASLYGIGHGHPRLAYAWLPKLADYCTSVGIEFMCTAFDVESLLYVNKYVKRHKLASSEMRHVGLIEKLKEFKKPILVSVGGHSLDRIEKTVFDLLDQEVTLLYCSNTYPTRMHNLDMIEELRRKFMFPVGFSDHTIDCYTSYSAVKHYGAEVIEKHVNFVGSKGPDAPHSVDFNEFSELVRRIRGKADLKHPAIDEEMAVLAYNRRVVATQSLNCGDQLQLGRNIGIFRCRTKQRKYLDPSMAKDVDGKRASTGINAGDAIGPGDFK